MRNTLILGAGLSGLTAARTLHDAGRAVAVFDKGRGVGGRLATRRIGEAVLDHGAQFFTVRGDDFQHMVEQAQAAGVVAEWCRGFGEPDGYPRYRGSTGMTALAKWLARDVDITLSAQAHSIAGHGDQVALVDSDGEVMASADDLIVTAPIPQMIDLFDRGDLTVPTELDATLRSTNYFATLALLAVVDGAPAVDEPGGMQFDSGPFTFIADNQRKGISPTTALTFHAEHDYSLRRFDDDSAEVHAELLEQAAPWIGSANVVDSQLKKWRYAGPVTPLPNRTEIFAAGTARIALAGDAFGGPKVEGAFNSGLAAARALLDLP